MKKLFFLLACTMAILFVFLSCEDATGNGYVPNVLGNTQVTLLIADHHTSRTILPDDWDDTKKNELSYHLVATNLMYTAEVIEKDYNWENFTDGKITLDLAASRWQFDLKASKAGVEILSGIAVADLRNGPQTVTFNLKPVGDADGRVNVKLTYTKPSDYPEIVKKITVGLYDKESDFEKTAKVGGTEVTINEPTSNTPYVLFDEAIAPGKYYYIAGFYNEAGTLLMPYIEEVYVDPGNTSTKEIELGDIINTPPKSPTEFNVTYLSNTLGTVQVEFKWRDNAINETGFVLEVDEYSDPATLVETVTYDENSNLDEIDEYIDGNLIARADESAPTFTINLKTGTLYKARIKAVNEFGESDYCDYENADSENFINLAVIAMHLNGGTVKTPETGAEISPEVFYGLAKQPLADNYATTDIYSFTYSVSKTYPLPKKQDEDPDNYIKRDGFTFMGWYHLIENGEDDAGQMDYLGNTAITEYAKKTYENDSIYALWNATATIEVFFPEYTDDTNLLVTPDGQVFYSDVDVGAPIVFTGPETVNEKPAVSWRWTVDGVTKATTQSWTYTTEGTETEAKNHVVMLEVEDITGRTYSNTVYIRVRNTVTEP